MSSALRFAFFSMAAALAFAAGVMIYVSFLDIFAKALDAFLEAGADEPYAYLYSTLCFSCPT